MICWLRARLRLLAFRAFEGRPRRRRDGRLSLGVGIWDLDLRLHHRFKPLCWLVEYVYGPIWRGEWLAD